MQCGSCAAHLFSLTHAKYTTRFSWVRCFKATCYSLVTFNVENQLTHGLQSRELDSHLTFQIWKKNRRWIGLGEARHPGVHGVGGFDAFEELTHDT